MWRQISGGRQGGAEQSKLDGSGISKLATFLPSALLPQLNANLPTAFREGPPHRLKITLSDFYSFVFQESLLSCLGTLPYSMQTPVSDHGHFWYFEILPGTLRNFYVLQGISRYFEVLLSRPKVRWKLGCHIFSKRYDDELSGCQKFGLYVHDLWLNFLTTCPQI